MKDILKARSAILDDLKRRGAEGDASVKPSPYDRGQENQWIGSGTIDCPVCGSGRLHYSRASNLYVHAACSTQTCVRWME